MGVPIYLDSWWEPSATAIAWAKGHACPGWLGYFKQTPTDNVYHGWADATFKAVQAAGLATAAYCSGHDDPLWVRQRAASLGITAILDVESSIEPDGPWVDPWLAASGAAIYGLGPTINNHRDHGHPGYVLAGYPSNSGTITPIDPGLTWTVAMPSPLKPIGRQYAGGVPTPYGAVDYSHFVPAFFAGGDPVTEGEKIALVQLAYGIVRPQATPNYTTEVLPHAALILDDGSNAHTVIGGVLYSPEGLNTQKAVAAILAAGPPQPTPAPGVVPAHTHSVAGSTGPVVVNVA